MNLEIIKNKLIQGLNEYELWYNPKPKAPINGVLIDKKNKKKYCVLFTVDDWIPSKKFDNLSLST